MLHTKHKQKLINSKLIIDINVREKTVEILGEDIKDC